MTHRLTAAASKQAVRIGHMLHAPPAHSLHAPLSARPRRRQQQQQPSSRRLVVFSQATRSKRDYSASATDKVRSGVPSPGRSQHRLTPTGLTWGVAALTQIILRLPPGHELSREDVQAVFDYPRNLTDKCAEPLANPAPSPLVARVLRACVWSVGGGGAAGCKGLETCQLQPGFGLGAGLI